jgi:hypothetical protein
MPAESEDKTITPTSDGSISDSDVVMAYRWLLGRNPETPEVIEAHLRASKNWRELRMRIMMSPEFSRKIAHHVLAEAVIGDFPRRTERAGAARLVFVHVPRTGGTTLHSVLSAAIDRSEVCPERHNRLESLYAAQIANTRLFSGHYDRRSLDLIPGRNIRSVTMLREPRARIISVYKYLRAHTSDTIANDDLELAKLAKSCCFGDFMRAALAVNPSTVDNTYVRCFGWHLPRRRWEQRAEPSEIHRVDNLGERRDTLLSDALFYLDRMSFIGITEHFDYSLRNIFAAFDLIAPASYTVRHRLSDITASDPAFEPVQEFQLTPSDEELLEELTCLDSIVYRWALDRMPADFADRRPEPQVTGVPGNHDHGTSE